VDTDSNPHKGAKTQKRNATDALGCRIRPFGLAEPHPSLRCSTRCGWAQFDARTIFRGAAGSQTSRSNPHEFVSARFHSLAKHGPPAAGFQHSRAPVRAPNRARCCRDDCRRVARDRQTWFTAFMIRQSDENPGRTPKPPSPRSLLLSIERALASKSNDPSARAQDLFYEAMDAPTDEAELALLEKALKLDSSNVDVLLALFRHETLSQTDAIEFLQKLVKLAETRLGPEAFQEFAGAFWGFHKTRPYMRVRAMLAEQLRAAGRVEEAIAEWQAMLVLNPGDNQGLRYALLSSLLALHRLEEARKLFENYPGEFAFNAAFAWGRVLERFLANDLAGVMAALAVARKQNPHMQVYVKGHRALPRYQPEAYAPGSKEEAICFAEGVRAAWAKYPAALKWLEAQKLK